MIYEEELNKLRMEHALIIWAISNQLRDTIVLKALEAGISVNRIASLTRIARTTIERIKSGEEKDGEQ